MSRETDEVGGMGGARSAGSSARLFHPVDTILAILILCIVAWLYYETAQFEEVSDLFSQNIPPELFPRILLFIIAMLALVMPFEHLLLKRKGKDIDKGRREPVKLIAWVTMAVLLAIIAASQWLGTLLTMVAVCLVIPLVWGERRLRYVLPFAVIFPVCVAFLFSVILGVHFDPGAFGVSIR